jgi:hypothetical protein
MSRARHVLGIGRDRQYIMPEQSAFAWDDVTQRVAGMAALCLRYATRPAKCQAASISLLS